MSEDKEFQKQLKELKKHSVDVHREIKNLRHYFKSEEEATNQIRDDVKKLEKIKTEILGYTLQSVTIVVGMLALILSITFFWFNISNLSDEMYRLFVAIIIFFGGILVLWFILWIRRG